MLRFNRRHTHTHTHTHTQHLGLFDASTDVFLSVQLTFYTTYTYSHIHALHTYMQHEILYTTNPHANEPPHNIRTTLHMYSYTYVHT